MAITASIGDRTMHINVVFTLLKTLEHRKRVCLVKKWVSVEGRCTMCNLLPILYRFRVLASASDQMRGSRSAIERLHKAYIALMHMLFLFLHILG